MISFDQVWEAMEKAKSPLMNSGDSSETIAIARTGEDLCDGKFWENFIKLCSNSNGMAQLLGVSPEKVIGWPAKIKNALEDLQKDKEEQGKTTLIPTGDNLNTDPDLGQM
jgi:hypothetical protein